MKIFFKSIVIALTYYICIILAMGCMFALFTALFQRWDLWPAIFTTEAGRIIYFSLSVIVMLIALYMAMAYVSYEKSKTKNDEKTN